MSSPPPVRETIVGGHGLRQRTRRVNYTQVQIDEPFGSAARRPSPSRPFSSSSSASMRPNVKAKKKTPRDTEPFVDKEKDGGPPPPAALTRQDKARRPVYVKMKRDQWAPPDSESEERASQALGLGGTGVLKAHDRTSWELYEVQQDSVLEPKDGDKSKEDARTVAPPPKKPSKETTNRSEKRIGEVKEANPNDEAAFISASAETVPFGLVVEIHKDAALEAAVVKAPVEFEAPRLWTHRTAIRKPKMKPSREIEPNLILNPVWALRTATPVNPKWQVRRTVLPPLPKTRQTSLPGHKYLNNRFRAIYEANIRRQSRIDRSNNRKGIPIYEISLKSSPKADRQPAQEQKEQVAGSLDDQLAGGSASAAESVAQPLFPKPAFPKINIQEILALLENPESQSSEDLFRNTVIAHQALEALKSEYIEVRKITDDEDNAKRRQANDKAIVNWENRLKPDDINDASLLKTFDESGKGPPLFEVKGVRARKPIADDPIMERQKVNDQVMAATYGFPYNPHHTLVGRQDPALQRDGGHGTRSKGRSEFTEANVVEGKRQRKPRIFDDMSAPASRSATPRLAATKRQQKKAGCLEVPKLEESSAGTVSAPASRAPTPPNAGAGVCNLNHADGQSMLFAEEPLLFKESPHGQKRKRDGPPSIFATTRKGGAIVAGLLNAASSKSSDFRPLSILSLTNSDSDKKRSSQLKSTTPRVGAPTKAAPAGNRLTSLATSFTSEPLPFDSRAIPSRPSTGQSPVTTGSFDSRLSRLLIPPSQKRKQSVIIDDSDGTDIDSSPPPVKKNRNHSSSSNSSKAISPGDGASAPSLEKDYSQMTKSEKMSQHMKNRWIKGEMNVAVEKRKATMMRLKAQKAALAGKGPASGKSAAHGVSADALARAHVPVAKGSKATPLRPVSAGSVLDVQRMVGSQIQGASGSQPRKTSASAGLSGN